MLVIQHWSGMQDTIRTESPSIISIIGVFWSPKPTRCARAVVNWNTAKAKRRSHQALPAAASMSCEQPRPRNSFVVFPTSVKSLSKPAPKCLSNVDAFVFRRLTKAPEFNCAATGPLSWRGRPGQAPLNTIWACN